MKSRHEAAKLMPYARRVFDAIKPACVKCTIAGSLRRRAEFVSDFEIVALPIREVALIGEGDDYPELNRVIGELIASDVIKLDMETPRNGPLHKRFIMRLPEPGIVFELFVTRPDNWGNLLAIRTGDELFSKALVRRHADGGLMPAGMVERGGFLWAHPGPEFPVPPDTVRELVRDRWSIVSCPTEQDFFAALGVSMPAPEKRTAIEANRLHGEQRARAVLTPPVKGPDAPDHDDFVDQVFAIFGGRISPDEDAL